MCARPSAGAIESCGRRLGDRTAVVAWRRSGDWRSAAGRPRQWSSESRDSGSTARLHDSIFAHPRHSASGSCGITMAIEKKLNERENAKSTKWTVAVSQSGPSNASRSEFMSAIAKRLIRVLIRTQGGRGCTGQNQQLDEIQLNLVWTARNRCLWLFNLHRHSINTSRGEDGTVGAH